MRPDRISKRPLDRLLLVGLACVGLAGGAIAQPAANTGPRQEDDGAAVGRVLFLQDGRTVRATSRKQDGRWQIKRDGAWKAVSSHVSGFTQHSTSD